MFFAVCGLQSFFLFFWVQSNPSRCDADIYAHVSNVLLVLHYQDISEHQPIICHRYTHIAVASAGDTSGNHQRERRLF